MSLSIKIESDSSPYVEGAETMDVITSAHVCSGERACLSDVEGVSVFLLALTRRGIPLSLQCLVLRRTTSFN